jgi:hypothetical protein
MRPLSEFRTNITSQYGEDGIIEELFNRLGAEDPFCIEFGAWDGKYLSNVWNLWHNKSWNALLVEAEKERADQLAKSISDFKKVTVHCTYVAPTGPDSIGEIVKKMNLPAKVDLLSIDIDGNDYFIFESLSYIKPRVIIVEYNPTIPPHLEIVQKEGEYFGASALSLCQLASSKGYKLAAITDTNLFFVESSDFAKLEIDELNLKRDFLGTHLAYVYSSYDGKTFIDKTPPYVWKLEKISDGLLKQTKLDAVVRRILKKRIDAIQTKHPKIVAKNDIIPVQIYRTNKD